MATPTIFPKLLEIATDADPFLKLTAAEVSEEEMRTADLQQLLLDMQATMTHAKGIGLAAPQIRVSKRIIVFYLPKSRDNIHNKGVIFTRLINPVIEPILECGTNSDFEGCLSVPGMRGKVLRYNKIKYYGWSDCDEDDSDDYSVGIIPSVIDTNKYGIRPFRHIERIAEVVCIY